jgi:hypothetical protein
MQEEGFIYNWNSPDIFVSRPVAFCDEALRAGLQSPSIRIRSVEERRSILHVMISLAICSETVVCGMKNTWRMQFSRRNTGQGTEGKVYDV